ncbi:MAG TPA: hypothetical protein PLL10_09200, partial [Elusimicrobiales bacterium]|nr:hypothetical protein [Elusimicrobiales bacterium]
HNFESRIVKQKLARLYVGGYGGWQLPEKVCVSPACVLAGYGGTIASSAISPYDGLVLYSPDGRRVIFGGGTAQGDGSTLYSASAQESASLVLRGGKYYWTTPEMMVYVYDEASGLLERIVDRNNKQLTLFYVSYRLDHITDPDSRTLFTFSYDGNGRLATVTDIGGRAYSLQYDSYGRLSSYEDTEGRTTFEYQSQAIPGLDSFADGYFTATTISAVTLLTRINSPDGSYVSYEYGPSQYMVDHSTVPLVAGITPAVNFTAPLVSGMANPQGNVYTVPLYGADGGYRVNVELFSRWYFPARFYTLAEERNGSRTTFEYSVDEKLSVGSTKTTMPLGQVYTRLWHLQNGEAVTDSITGPGGTSKIAYDSNGNPVKFTDEAGRVTSVGYDSKNRITALTNALRQTTRITYNDTANRPATVTDAKGNTVRYGYDTSGRIVSVTNGAGQATQY